MTAKLVTDRATVAYHRAQRKQYATPGLLLPDSLSSAAVFWLAGVASAGWRDDGRSLLLRWPFDKPAQALHAVESWYQLSRLAMAAWGATPLPEQPPKRLELPLNAAAVDQAQASLDKAGLADQAFVLIAPTATGLHRGQVKVWPHFADLIHHLRQHGLAVAYCVPPKEVEQARRNAFGALALPSLPLAAFAALTRAASLVVCNDSGVSHLAAAAGARQLTLFGVTSPARTGPWSPRARCLGKNGQWPTLPAVIEAVLKTIAETRA
jgi:heptosyltransferase-2